MEHLIIVHDYKYVKRHLQVHEPTYTHALGMVKAVVLIWLGVGARTTHNPSRWNTFSTAFTYFVQVGYIEIKSSLYSLERTQ